MITENDINKLIEAPGFSSLSVRYEGMLLVFPSKGIEQNTLFSITGFNMTTMQNIDILMEDLLIILNYGDNARVNL